MHADSQVALTQVCFQGCRRQGLAQPGGLRLDAAFLGLGFEHLHTVRQKAGVGDFAGPGGWGWGTSGDQSGKEAREGQIPGQVAP